MGASGTSSGAAEPRLHRPGRRSKGVVTRPREVTCRSRLGVRGSWRDAASLAWGSIGNCVLGAARLPPVCCGVGDSGWRLLIGGRRAGDLACTRGWIRFSLRRGRWEPGRKLARRLGRPGPPAATGRGGVSHAARAQTRGGAQVRGGAQPAANGGRAPRTTIPHHLLRRDGRPLRLEELCRDVDRG